MLKKTITFTDYEDKERVEDFYFNLNKVEVMELEVSKDHKGLVHYVQRLVDTKNGGEIMAIIREIIKKSVGVKSTDGRRFIKSEEVISEFMDSEAYVELFYSLVTDADACGDFISAIAPKATTNVTELPKQ